MSPEPAPPGAHPMPASDSSTFYAEGAIVVDPATGVTYQRWQGHWQRVEDILAEMQP